MSRPKSVRVGIAVSEFGYRYRDGEWRAPGAVAGAPVPLTTEADAIHGALMLRADALVGCTGSSDEGAELRLIVDLLEAYECKRWPLGKEPGDKG